MGKERTDEEILKGKKSLVLFYEPTNTMLKKLDNEQAGALFKAIFDYELNGISYGGSDKYVDMAFASIKSSLDNNKEQYINTSRKNSQNIKMRWDKEKAKEYDGIRSNTMDTDKDNDNDNDKDKDKDKECRNTQRSYSSYIPEAPTVPKFVPDEKLRELVPMPPEIREKLSTL